MLLLDRYAFLSGFLAVIGFRGAVVVPLFLVFAGFVHDSKLEKNFTSCGSSRTTVLLGICGDIGRDLGRLALLLLKKLLRWWTARSS